jgi:hypothetical protein
LTADIIQDKIKEVINQWTPEIRGLKSHQNIIALNFGIQSVFDGFELCLSGHSWYDESGLWYLDEEWNPEKNYISLGQESQELDRLKILDIYQKTVQEAVTGEKEIYRKLIVIVGPVDGEPTRLK